MGSSRLAVERCTRVSSCPRADTRCTPSQDHDEGKNPLHPVHDEKTKSSMNKKEKNAKICITPSPSVVKMLTTVFEKEKKNLVSVSEECSVKMSFLDTSSV